MGAWLCCGHATAQLNSQVVPPRVKTQVAPAVASELIPASGADVILEVTVSDTGAVSDAAVFRSAGDALDRAAVDAMRQWTFEPARREGQPLASRVHIPLHFEAPPAPVAASESEPQAAASEAATAALPATSADAPSAAQAPPPADAPAVADGPGPPQPSASPEPNTPSSDDDASYGASAHAHRHPARAASDFVISRAVIAAAPHADAGGVLSTAPGVYVARPEGEAIAHEIFLRGFDAEHGQDIALSAAGVPINMPSHVHGQGYADLNFIPPEVIRAVRVTEGVFDPHQGDFAVAGSVDFDLGVVPAERGMRSTTTLGSFGSIRQLLLWAPRDQDEQTFGVAAVSRSDGFGQNRGSSSGLAMGQLVLGSASDRTTIHAAAYGGRANLAGVLRRDDVAKGRVGFYDSYDDPSAQAQSAFASRLQLSVNHVRAADSGARLQLGAWLASTDFALRENFTGYLQRSIQMPEWVARGDLIEQRNRDLAFGGSASYEAEPFIVSDALLVKAETGLTFRLDTIEQTQRLLQPPQNETWDERVDAGVSGADIGAYVDLSFRFWSWLTLRGGGRADVLYYDIEDRLGNFIPRFRREMYIVGFRRTALGIALGPRGTLEAKLSPNVSLLLSAGRGYRSPQARQLEEGETAPFAVVDSFEVGTKLALARELLTLSAAAYRTHLSLDLAFDPSEGRLERIGPTTRQGVALQLQAKPVSWLIANASLTWVHATLDAPPPPTAAEPNPPYRNGQALPYVPPFVARVDLGAHHPLFALGRHDVEGRIGFGLTALGKRPLPYSELASGFAVVDATLHLRWSFVDFGVDISNLFDAKYAASEYSFVSDWRATQTPSLLPARHFAAGPPRLVMFNLGLTL